VYRFLFGTESAVTMNVIRQSIVSFPCAAGNCLVLMARL
jgi:hypothetical protein